MKIIYFPSYWFDQIDYTITMHMIYIFRHFIRQTTSWWNKVQVHDRLHLVNLIFGRLEVGKLVMIRLSSENIEQCIDSEPNKIFFMVCR